uniref:Uncharacterized protein n=1 Tax=Myoviridae sp. ctzS633 TaxID=2825212 RepID=A0A8S5PTY6_9CAUD|nr:MAG TPA: hypothetical protein [Myoviridae sp. ctzS633]
MVSVFSDISKIVILFNCGVDSAELHECLCSICNKQLTGCAPGLLPGRGVVVGAWVMIRHCGSTPSPTRKNGGGLAGEV